MCVRDCVRRQTVRRPGGTTTTTTIRGARPTHRELLHDGDELPRVLLLPPPDHVAIHARPLAAPLLRPERGGINWSVAWP